MLGRQLRLDGRVDPLGHVLDAHEDVQLQVVTAFLLSPRLGMEAVAVIIVVLVAELLQTVGADVVIGHDQAVRRDERAGAAAVEAHRGFLHMFEPGIGGVETELFLEQLAGRVVE